MRFNILYSKTKQLLSKFLSAFYAYDDIFNNESANCLEKVRILARYTCEHETSMEYIDIFLSYNHSCSNYFFLCMMLFKNLPFIF